MSLSGLVSDIKKRTEGCFRREYVRQGLLISTVAVLINRFRLYGALLSVPVLTSLQYMLLCLEHSEEKNATVIKFDLSTGHEKEEADEDKKKNIEAAKRMRKILESCATLRSPSYFPTPWATDTWTNIGLYMMKSHIYTNYINVPVRTHFLRMEDGGEVSVDVCEDKVLNEDAPVVILLHTLTGSAKELKIYMRHAIKRGWRPVVFDRRGHSSRLRTPVFNLMGEAADTKQQVEFVRKLFPTQFLGMIGISAGSGLLVNYLGKENILTPIGAACCLCPAYDISQAFKRLATSYPRVDRVMVSSVKKLFINPNSELLGIHCFESLEMCANAETLDEFVRHHHVFAGSESVDDYFEKNNPMEWISKVSVPLLVVNSEDDMVCLPQNIREDLFKYNYGNAVLLKTKRGSHIAYNEGVFGTGSYLPRISLDFLEASKKILEESAEA